MDFLDIINTVLLFAIAVLLWLQLRRERGTPVTTRPVEPVAPTPGSGPVPRIASASFEEGDPAVEVLTRIAEINEDVSESLGKRGGPCNEPGTDAWPVGPPRPFFDPEQLGTLEELMRVEGRSVRCLLQDIKCRGIAHTRMTSKFFEEILARVPPTGDPGDPDSPRTFET